MLHKVRTEPSQRSVCVKFVTLAVIVSLADVPGLRAGPCAHSGRTFLGAAESWLSSYVRFGPQGVPKEPRSREASAQSGATGSE